MASVPLLRKFLPLVSPSTSTLGEAQDMCAWPFLDNTYLAGHHYWRLKGGQSGMASACG